MNQTIHLFEKWHVKKGQLNTVLNLLVEVARVSTEVQGNIYFKVHQSQNDSHTLLLFQGYADQTAFIEYNRSEYNQHLMKHQIIPLLDHQESMVSRQLLLGLPGIEPRFILN